MILDQQAQRMRGRAIEFEATGHSQRQLRAHFRMFPARRGLAGIVEQEGEIENEGALEALKKLDVFILRRRGVVPDAVKLLEADEGMFVGRVLGKELMLNQPGRLAKFRTDFSKKPTSCHARKEGSTLPA